MHLITYEFLIFCLSIKLENKASRLKKNFCIKVRDLLLLVAVLTDFPYDSLMVVASKSESR